MSKNMHQLVTHLRQKPLDWSLVFGSNLPGSPNFFFEVPLRNINSCLINIPVDESINNQQMNYHFVLKHFLPSANTLQIKLCKLVTNV
jgi:hypothetical protein